MQLDTSYARARPLILRQHEAVEIDLVGVGGTGGFLAPYLARLARLIQDSGRAVTLKFIDHDRVEEKNIPRQNFCYAELGANKAVTMAARCGAALGLEIAASEERFESERFYSAWNKLTILVGCVDNAAARRAMAKALTGNEQERAPRIWWLDCGNAKSGGQVLLGSAATPEGMRGAFTFKNRCLALPSPSLQAHDLLVPLPEERAGEGLTCAELMRANEQSLTINPAMAVVAYNFLYKLLIEGDLRMFSTTIAMNAGVWTSKYTTPETLSEVLGVTPAFFEGGPPARR